MARQGHFGSFHPWIQSCPVTVKPLDRIDDLRLIQHQLLIKGLQILTVGTVDADLLINQIVQGVLVAFSEQSLVVIVQLGVGERVLNESHDEAFLIDLLVQVLVVLGP